MYPKTPLAPTSGPATLLPAVQQLSLYGLNTLEAPGQIRTTSVNTLLAISHSIENVVSHYRLPGAFYAGFQRTSAFLPQARRFSALAAACGRVVVFAYPDVAAPVIPGVEFVYLTKDAPLAQEWFLIFANPEFQVALLTREMEGPGELEHFGRGRDYEGLVTFTPQVVATAGRALTEALGRPEEDLPMPAANPNRQESATPYAVFHRNLIGYLEAGNQQLRGLYRQLVNRSEEIERLQAITRQYLSSATLESAVQEAQTGGLAPGLQSQMRTVLLTDIQDFVRLTEMNAPEKLADSLNRYLDVIASVIYQHGGDVDKFLGDGMLAVFDDPRRAMQAAVDLQQRVEAFNIQQAAARRISMPTRVSVATGLCLVGPLGSRDRKEVTLIGRPVNLASRLNGQSPVGGIVVDDETYRRLKSPLFAARTSIRVKNMDGFLPVYEFAQPLLKDLSRYLERIGQALKPAAHPVGGGWI